MKSRVRHGNFEEFGLNNWSISKSQNGGTEPGVRNGKRSLLASHTRCICSLYLKNDVKNDVIFKGHIFKNVLSKQQCAEIVKLYYKHNSPQTVFV